MLRLGEINLYVGDLERSATFYGRALGFARCEESDPPGRWLKVRRDAVTLLFFPAAAGGRGRLGAGPGMTADLVVDDFDAAVGALAAAGAAVEPVSAQDGLRYTIFRDPDGIEWELVAS